MHEPVLLKEVLEIFNPQPGQTYIDMTVNGGGHSRAIAQRVGPAGKVVGIDWDCGLIRELGIKNKKSGIKNITLACDNYVNLKRIAHERGASAADGILFDLGFSSYHTDESGRGFSFQRDEPLDMRYHPSGNTASAEQIINHDTPETIENIIRAYGGERYAHRIAAAIADRRRRRRIATTRDLAAIIRQAVPAPYRRGRIHPATRTFQALRIAVNRELENLQSGLSDTAEVLASGGTIIVISFHSLEDRIVKRFFKEKSEDGILELIMKKPICASREEKNINPRARSARLRAATKLASLAPRERAAHKI